VVTYHSIQDAVEYIYWYFLCSLYVNTFNISIRVLSLFVIYFSCLYVPRANLTIVSVFTVIKILFLITV